MAGENFYIGVFKNPIGYYSLFGAISKHNPDFHLNILKDEARLGNEYIGAIMPIPENKVSEIKREVSDLINQDSWQINKDEMKKRLEQLEKLLKNN